MTFVIHLLLSIRILHPVLFQNAVDSTGVRSHRTVLKIYTYIIQRNIHGVLFVIIRLQPVIITAWRNLHDSYSGILTPGEAEQFISTANKLITKLEDSVLQE